MACRGRTIRFSTCRNSPGPARIASSCASRRPTPSSIWKQRGNSSWGLGRKRCWRCRTDAGTSPLSRYSGRGVGGEGSIPPLSRYSGRGVGGEGMLLPSGYSGRGVGGEGRRTGSLACPEGLADRQGCLSYEGSNMPSPPTPLPEYRERGATRPHPRPLSRSPGEGRNTALTPDPSPRVPGEAGLEFR